MASKRKYQPQEGADQQVNKVRVLSSDLDTPSSLPRRLANLVQQFGEHSEECAALVQSTNGVHVLTAILFDFIEGVPSHMERLRTLSSENLLTCNNLRSYIQSTGVGKRAFCNKMKALYKKTFGTDLKALNPGDLAKYLAPETYGRILRNKTTAEFLKAHMLEGGHWNDYMLFPAYPRETLQSNESVLQPLAQACMQEARWPILLSDTEVLHLKGMIFMLLQSLPAKMEVLSSLEDAQLTFCLNVKRYVEVKGITKGQFCQDTGIRRDTLSNLLYPAKYGKPVVNKKRYASIEKKLREEKLWCDTLVYPGHDISKLVDGASALQTQHQSRVQECRHLIETVHQLLKQLN